jgi:hypothetical protein
MRRSSRSRANVERFVATPASGKKVVEQQPVPVAKKPSKRARVSTQPSKQQRSPREEAGPARVQSTSPARAEPPVAEVRVQTEPPVVQARVQSVPVRAGGSSSQVLPQVAPQPAEELPRPAAQPDIMRSPLKQTTLSWGTAGSVHGGVQRERVSPFRKPAEGDANRSPFQDLQRIFDGKKTKKSPAKRKHENSSTGEPLLPACRLWHEVSSWNAPPPRCRTVQRTEPNNIVERPGETLILLSLLLQCVR